MLIVVAVETPTLARLLRHWMDDGQLHDVDSLAYECESLERFVVRFKGANALALSKYKTDRCIATAKELTSYIVIDSIPLHQQHHMTTAYPHFLSDTIASHPTYSAFRN